METINRPQRPAGVRRLLFRLPIWLYQVNLGWVLGRRFVLIHHVGRKSGKRRKVVVEVVTHDPGTSAVTVASGFGPGADWYRNLLAHPDAAIELGNQTLAVRAEAVPPESGADVMLDYARQHPRAARSLCRFMGFRVDGSHADYRAVGREIPFLRLRPLPAADGGAAGQVPAG